MRKFSLIMSLFVVSAFCALLPSCSSDDGGGNSSDGGSSFPNVYLPDEFSGKKVDALYVKSESGDYPSESDVRDYSGTYSFYFFSDKTFVMTVHAEWTQSGQKMTINKTVYEGTFTKTGDYTNGTLNCTTTNSQNPLGCAPMPPVPSELVVSEGKFSVQSYVFTRE